MNLSDFVSSPAGAVTSLTIGAVLSFLITKWALGRSERTQLLTAAEGIKGTADRLLSIERDVTDIRDRLDENLARPIPASSIVGDGEFAGLLSTNKQLVARLRQGAEEKMAAGRYIQSQVLPSAAFAIDCGTSAAWAWFEMIRHGKMEYRLVTNNIFVASSIAAEFHFSDEADIWGVDETASNCFLTEGHYFPSYGGILDTTDDSEQKYTEKLDEHKPEAVMLGCTSFRAIAGPSARSGANRRFKRSLLSYTVRNDHVKLFLLLSVGKIGRQIGEPCDTDLWQALLARKDVHILCGTTLLPDDLAAMTENETAHLREELRTLDSLDAKVTFVATDVQGTVVDLRRHWMKG